MSSITGGTTSNVSYSYSYSKQNSPSRGEILSFIQDMREIPQSKEDLEKLEQVIYSYTEMMGIIVNLQIKIEELSLSFSDVLNSSYAVVKAIDNKGSHPEYHNKILEQHKSEWPFIWNKLENLCNVVNKEISKNL
jgi:hypothetical protein